MEETTEITVNQSDENLLNIDFMRKIEHLVLLSRKIHAGSMKGDRRSINRGTSVEFADYRGYSSGDDFRHIDWNVYARVEKLFMKLFVEEEDLNVYLLIDASKSMDFGKPSKIFYAKQVAAALSYISLCNMDRLRISSLKSEKAEIFGPVRSKHSASSVFTYLEKLSANAKTDLSKSIRDFNLRTANPGLAIIISDFFDDGYQNAISSLIARKFDVVILHLLDKNEIEPTVTGDLLMIDSETAGRREVTVTRSLLNRYKERIGRFFSEIESYSSTFGCGYLRITTDIPFEDLILRYLRRKGLLG